jgi:hypothetical protein
VDKPAVICSHWNQLYDSKNSDNGLKKVIIIKTTKKWPDVEFLGAPNY